MTMSLVPILIHDDSVPERAREALKAAFEASPETREAELEAAARVLFRETDLDCADVRELVGLAEVGACY